MRKKRDFSKKIIKLLDEKPAISVSELTSGIGPNKGSKRPKYAITRSLKGLQDTQLIEKISSGQSEFFRLTNEGKKRANSLKLDSDTAVLNPNWDGFWRIILLDLPEERKSEREALRYLLKKAGFICLKNSAWISPYPFEHLFTNIKKDLGLTTEFMIIVTQFVDEITAKELFKTFGM